MKGAETTPDEVQLIRVQLTTTSFLSKSLPSSMLGVHEANRLYQSKEAVELTVPELVAMLRLLVTDDSDYVPGWYWVKEVDPVAIEGVMVNLAITDTYSHTRYSAFNLLARAVFPLRQIINRRSKPQSRAIRRRRCGRRPYVS